MHRIYKIYFISRVAVAAALMIIDNAASGADSDRSANGFMENRLALEVLVRIANWSQKVEG